MALYQYEAADASGTRRRGALEAGSRREALRALEQQGLQPVSLEESAGLGFVRASAADRPGVMGERDLVFFTEDLADLLDAGLQLEPALKVVSRRQEKGVAAAAAKLRDDLREGASFAAALRRMGGRFDDLYCSVVEAGEVTGALPSLLRRHAAYLASILDLRSKVQTALIYPAVLMVSAALLVLFFITYLVPQLKRLILQTGRSLPLPTQLLIGTGDFLLSYGWLLLVLGVVLGTLAWWQVRAGAGRLWWHRARLRLPLFGPVIAMRLHIQITHTLGALLASGINLTRSMRLMMRGVGNEHVRARLENACQWVEQGAGLSMAMRRADTLPETALDMIAVGEQSGDLAGALMKVAGRLDKQMETQIQRLTSIIPLVIILVMALLIGLIAVSIFFAIFDSIRGLRMQSV